MVPMWMYPISIACGNVILKPLKKILHAYKTCRIIFRGSLPDYIFNVIHGDKNIVDLILESKDVSAISFDGSTPLLNKFIQNLPIMENEYKL